MNYWQQSNRNIYVAAHRGWKDRYPENTLEAFQGALELGVDQLETDVRVTKDGALVLIHDATLDRTTNGSGEVCDYTLEELKALDAGEGCRIPTLEEFFELIKDHPSLTIDIELKEYPTEGREALAYEICDRTLRMIDAYGYTDRCVINSWDGKLNQYIAETYGAKYKQHVYFPQSCLRNEYELDPYSYAYCACVFADKEKGFDEEGIRTLRARGVRIWAGTYAKDEESIDRAVSFGSELITCNNPDEVLAILRAKGLHS